MSQNEKPPSRWWALVIGSGLALLPIHNRAITDWATTTGKGETLVFLPAMGYLLLIMGTGLFLLNYWEQVRAVGWGDKRIIGCLLFIALAIALSGANAEGVEAKFAPLGMGLSLLAVYVMARTLGRKVFLPLAVGAAVASLGVILYVVLYPGLLTGGFVFEHNYNIVVGYTLLGAAMFVHKWQWLLAGLALVAILLTGSPEGIFVLGVLVVAVLLRRDWSRKLAMITALVLAVMVIGLVFGYSQTLFSYAAKVATGESATPYPDYVESSPIKAIDYRVQVAVEALSDIKPLGNGYNVTDFGRSPNVHNVPLVIVQQLGYPGILAGLAWLYVSIWCLVKTKWKYAWILVLALSVWDHFIWTQLAPYFWVIVGVTTAPGNIGSDLVFRQDKGVKRVQPARLKLNRGLR